MAHISISFPSKTLKMPVEAEELIPQMKGVKYKVVILLHTQNNDRMEWLLKSPVYDIVEDLPVLVFMPSGKNSFFVNTVNGYHYMDFISKEIPEFIKSHFNVSEDKKDWLIAGADMGAYGALVNGLHHSKQFGNIGAFSGTLDIFHEKTFLPTLKKEWLFDAGRERNIELGYDLYSYVHAVEELDRPKIFMCCGTEDELLDMNDRLYGEMKEAYNITYVRKPGIHSFAFWNSILPTMFSWFREESV